MIKKASWQKKGHFDSVILVNVTPNGELARTYREIVDKSMASV